jgi:hypothetical protein
MHRPIQFPPIDSGIGQSCDVRFQIEGAGRVPGGMPWELEPAATKPTQVADPAQRGSITGWAMNLPATGAQPRTQQSVGF